MTYDQALAELRALEGRHVEMTITMLDDGRRQPTLTAFGGVVEKLAPGGPHGLESDGEAWSLHWSGDHGIHDGVISVDRAMFESARVQEHAVVDPDGPPDAPARRYRVLTVQLLGGVVVTLVGCF